MEETTGAPSSFAALSPRRLRASSRDGGGVVNRPPSPLTMLLSRHTRRREFIVGLVLTATTRRAQAEQPGGKAYRIAVVHPSLPVASLNETGGGPYWQDVFTELRRLGYVEGQNLVVERYSAEGRADRYAELA